MTETDPGGVRYVRPDRFTRTVLNPVVAWLARRGVSVLGTRELRVVGRRSGELRTTVVNLVELDGRRYLLAPRGTTDWVRNLRAAGTGELRVGRKVERFTAEELADDAKVPVLREYLRKWGWEVGKFVEGLDKHSSDEALAAAAPGFPVFAVGP